jgi:hypothetical protein
VTLDIGLPQHSRWRLLELDQHTVRRTGMNEGDHRAFRAGTCVFIDEPDTPRTEMAERGLDVVHP